MKPNNKNIFTVILTLSLYFSLTMFCFTGSIYYFLGNEYEKAKENIETEEINTENINNEINNNEENIKNENTIENKNNILIVIEKTSSYKIFVDIETRNMYLKTNTYNDNNFVMMYDNDKPKIYKGILNNETYEEFCEKIKIE